MFLRDKFLNFDKVSKMWRDDVTDYRQGNLLF